VSHTFTNAFGALALAVTDRMHEAMASVAGHGASGPAALVALDGEAGGGSIDTLRRILGITHSGTVRLVDRLAGAGLVERRVGADARAVAVHLTPQGRRMARRVLAAREAALEQVLAPLSAAQRRQLEPLLAAMIGVLGDGRICRSCDATRCPGCPNYKARLER
jgi:MarR family transcriptional regulator, negative regulator of the multidrug operon emrRAB